uniref:Uncharacterized protein n=1 Tax=Oryza sativa subsp. japonica TaxID=39947 RepID=Q69PB1_ORYSJ|nr:hypothetical protein [Oryza sativa Japonica Group]
MGPLSFFLFLLPSLSFSLSPISLCLHLQAAAGPSGRGERKGRRRPGGGDTGGVSCLLGQSKKKKARNAINDDRILLRISGIGLACGGGMNPSDESVQVERVVVGEELKGVILWDGASPDERRLLLPPLGSRLRSRSPLRPLGPSSAHRRLQTKKKRNRREKGQEGRRKRKKER